MMTKTPHTLQLQNIAHIARSRGITSGTETFRDALYRVHRATMDADQELTGRYDHLFAEKLLSTLLTGTSIPSTPILTNAGRDIALPLAACTVQEFSARSSANRDQMWLRAKSSLKCGMGIGFDFSKIADPVDEMMSFNAELLDLDKELVANRRRPVAAMFTLDAEHPRIHEFIRAKEFADLGKWRANLSVLFRGQHVELAFESLVEQIANSACRCGEPGVLFFDRFEDDNPTPQVAYETSAPCGEVGLSLGEVCHFWSVNLAQFTTRSQGSLKIRWADLRETIDTIVRALDSILNITFGHGAESIAACKRRIGVGVVGFHSALQALGISYNSYAAFHLARQVSEWITFCSHSASAELARTRGPFPLYYSSRFRDLAWLNRKGRYRTGMVPTADWDGLHRKIMDIGIRHASIVSYPPTGTSSRLLDTSASFEPIRNQQACIENQAVNVTTDVQIESHMRIYEAFSRFADESGSKTVALPRNATTQMTAGVFRSARRRRLKGITVFRNT